MENKIKLKSNKCGLLSKIPEHEKDRVLGFLIKSPGLISRKYSNYIETDFIKNCPYCEKENGNLVRH